MNHFYRIKILLQLGMVIWQIDGDLSEAERVLQRAIALKPDEKWAYLSLGGIYQQAGYIDRAAEAYQRVLEIDPEDKAASQFFTELGLEAN